MDAGWCGFAGAALDRVFEVEKFVAAVADFPSGDGVAKWFDQAMVGGDASEDAEGWEGVTRCGVWLENNVDRADCAGDLGFDFDFAEVGEEFFHPFFGKAVVDIAGHGVDDRAFDLFLDKGGIWFICPKVGLGFGWGRIVVIVVFLEVAATDETDDRADGDFPGVETGADDLFLFGVEVGLGADADGGATGDDCDGE